jgi:hypothetical protein
LLVYVYDYVYERLEVENRSVGRPLSMKVAAAFIKSGLPAVKGK